VDHLWTIICAALVFFMQAGFLLVTSGFTRAKNAANILMKSTLDFCLGSLVFLAAGFGLMYGTSNGYFGTDCFGLSGVEDLWAAKESANGAANLGRNWPYTFWMFQAAFAGAAATIVAGAAAERIKFSAYLVYSTAIVAFVYPIQGHWFWGNLFLGTNWTFDIGGISYALNDFAGSLVVHSTGGWAALAAAITLGPRIGKFGPKGTVRAIPGHNLLQGSMGVFVLFGWFGFNCGSTTAANDMIGPIAVVTTLGGCAGCCSALIYGWLVSGKPDVGLTLNGLLCGLVAVTAGCASITPGSAVLAGGIAGVLSSVAVAVLDKLKIDDPVGAVPVHLCGGIWGTIAAGVFMKEALIPAGGDRMGQVMTQFICIGINAVWTFGIMMLVFLVLKAIGQLRVSEEEELEGLDYGEHGASAYPDFTTTALK
jgi:ammonium transporter, Amt family